MELLERRIRGKVDDEKAPLLKHIARLVSALRPLFVELHDRGFTLFIVTRNTTCVLDPTEGYHVSLWRHT